MLTATSLLCYLQMTSSYLHTVLLIYGSIFYRKKQMLSPGETVLVFVPLCHVFGLHCILNASLMTGLKVILMSRFNPEHFLLLLQEYKVGLSNHKTVVSYIALVLAI